MKKDLNFGRTELPPELQQTVRRAIRLEWFTIGYLVVTVSLIAAVMGNSQAMRAAWVEDMLALIPPIAFLVAVAIIKKPPTRRRPYGQHRAVGVGHLISAAALLVMGSLLILESAIGLVKGEHPPIGTFHLFGHTLWQGWFMIVVMLLLIPVPVILGRMKIKLAGALHDKVLYADADMLKADWRTSLGTAVGVAGVGFGLWWFDAAAAIFVGLSVVKDGVSNMSVAVTDLTDSRARTIEGNAPHPLIMAVENYARGLEWVQDAGARVRDQGHVFHTELFIVPKDGASLTLGQLQELRAGIVEMDWKLADVVVAPVATLPAEVHIGT
ncbi:cation diffusion facilitator family transporter [Nesterenkonia sandarakina]|uniref:Divalent metal cation (Fe/Co/Zn/Cd) transporter n=1 Tax=Nesterenkonia sandarakina TaxID=272918 RepID=A0A7Z0E6C8_9MICC|nr:divalent metal cation (Fe/Co/Zn/Cd) transporter [Nesterenkonia sandarakina]